MKAHLILLLCLLALASPSHAATVFEVDLPLTNQADTVTTISGLGGSISGGQFGADGGTATSRDDLIILPLPPGIDASHGRLTFSEMTSGSLSEIFVPTVSLNHLQGNLYNFLIGRKPVAAFITDPPAANDITIPHRTAVDNLVFYFTAFRAPHRFSSWGPQGPAYG